LELPVAQEQHTDLVARCQEGDAVSFKKLYEQYARAMFNTSLRILNDRTDAEDILQEAFIEAFHNIKTFENRSSFGAWVKKIVINKSINQLKKKKINIVEIDAGQQYETDAEPVHDESEIRWQVQLILDSIKKLSPGYRTVVSLYLLEGYDHEEIAQIMGVAESTTRTQYIRGKQKLLQILKGDQ
jgi:RNA polymerase sigma-70 factor (ECF subfamily)